MEQLASDWSGGALDSGRYVIKKRIGEGGMGHVYLAHDTRLDTSVVIKAPHREMMSEPDVARRFIRESKSLVTLSHPHIVKVVDVGQYDQLPYIVMQFLAGGDLDDRLKAFHQEKNLPSVSQIAQWLLPIARALDYIHAKGYIHRDIKPANIIFDEHDNPYLSDFGIAKGLKSESRQLTQKLTSTGMAIGTPDYMAPELIMGQPADGRSDQYSLAILAYEAICGQTPFSGPTVGAIMVQHTQQPAPDPKQYNPLLSNEASLVLSRALEKSPAARFTSVEEFVESFGAQGSTNPSIATDAKLASTHKGSTFPTASNASPSVETSKTRKAPCLNCAQNLTVTSKLINKSARCPKCGTKLYIDARLNLTLTPPVDADKNLPTQHIKLTKQVPIDTPADDKDYHTLNKLTAATAAFNQIAAWLLSLMRKTSVRIALLTALFLACLAALFTYGAFESTLTSPHLISSPGEPGGAEMNGGELISLPINIVNPGQPEVHNLRTGDVYDNIQAAINAASPRDTLVLTEGIYRESLVVRKELTIRSYSGNAVIDGQGAEKVISLGSKVELQGLHVTNGRFAVDLRGYGGSYYVNRCVISQCEAAFSINQSSGRSGDAEINNCVVMDCSQAVNINDGGTVKITNSILDNVKTAYVATNARSILPTCTLLHTVQRRSAGNSSAAVQSDDGELIGDPLFLNPRAGNLLACSFGLKPNSPAIDSGTTVTAAESFKGQGPDRGVVESW